LDTVAIEAAVTVASESVDLLKSALGTVPTDGGKRHAPRDQRMKVYMGFQRAAHEASVWPAWLGVLEQQKLSPADVLPDLADIRRVTANLLAALSDIRMVGNPEPRRIAEEMVTLLVELMESRLPGCPVSGPRLHLGKMLYSRIDRAKVIEALGGRLPGAIAKLDEIGGLVDNDLRSRQLAKFNACQLALGTYNKRFTNAARRDLGYGPRFWQRSTKARRHHWQLWRQRDQWPGGWPPRDASELIADAERERLARPVTKAIESSQGQRAQANT
jgi:hypothetical protein